MFACSARCCESRSATRDEVERCVDACNVGMRNAQSVLERELGALQEQLSRCSMTCYDRQTQRYGPEPAAYKEAEMREFARALDACVAGCADDHLKLLPTIRERFVKSLSEKK